MAIITQQMLEDRVGEAELIRLTDDADSGETNTLVMDRIIDDAESELLSYLGQQYTLPLTLANAIDASVVRAHVLDVAVYRLYLHRDRSANEDLARVYKSAIEWAQQIAAGKIGLLAETKVASSPAAGGKIIVISDDAAISRETMEGL